MYPFGRLKQGVSRRTRDWLFLAILILLALNIIQFVLAHSGAGNSGHTESILLTAVETDVSSATTVASQLVRTGGSNTFSALSQVRQYLYGVSRTNGLYADLYGAPLLPSSSLDAALSAVSACEERLLAGSSISTPLNTLWAQLDALQTQADALR